MNENIDLTKILKGCPEGMKFYSSVYGEVAFVRVRPDKDYPIELKYYPEEIPDFGVTAFLTRDGRMHIRYDGECTLFPSKYLRDWSAFKKYWDKPKVERFDMNTLQPYDKVIVRDYNSSIWYRTFFGYMDDAYAMCLSDQLFFEPWKQCIPYNEETKHLIGTNKDCPEYYKWWEE